MYRSCICRCWGARNVPLAQKTGCKCLTILPDHLKMFAEYTCLPHSFQVNMFWFTNGSERRNLCPPWPFANARFQYQLLPADILPTRTESGHSFLIFGRSSQSTTYDN